MNEIIEQDCREILRRVDVKKAKNKKILITGANGFLGQYIVSLFSFANKEIGLDCKINAVSLSAPNKIISSLMSRDKNINYSRVDISKTFKREVYDYIFHAAGYGQPAKFVDEPLSLVKINVDATASLLESSPKATFVFFSSAEIYGEIPPEKIPVREDFNGNCFLHTPRSVYAEAKRLGEALCAAYKRKYGVNAKIVRISHVYGPGLPLDDKRVMSEFIRKASVEKSIKLLDEGKAVKTYGYIADVIVMILFIAFEGKGMIYNVGGKDSHSILGLAKKIAKYFKIKVEVPKDSSQLSHIGKEPSVVKLDLTKIKREMKKLKLTQFSEGLTRTIEWTVGGSN